MHKLLDRLHAKLGDLWWYSLMIFVACRSGDVIQAFIGLWLVPKYVGQEELGAVLPLQQLSGLFAVPLAILATVFAKYVNTYATRGEYGKVKSFIRDVLLATCGVFLVCIGAAYLVIPHFYERLNVQAGMLTVLVLAAGFATNIASIFTAALQGLKMFKTMTVQNLISAPIRLVTLLVAMPFRALSGYILGQTTPPASCSLLAALSLHRRLRAIPLDTTWRKDLPEIWRYLLPVAVYMGFAAIFAAISTTVYRQRLPEVESAAYYLLTRFAEIAGYAGVSMVTILIPLASEAHEKGEDASRLLRQTLYGVSVSTVLLAIVFIPTGRHLLMLSDVWEKYVPYAGLLPWMTGITGGAMIITSFVLYDMACRRFAAAYYVVLINMLWIAFIVCFTGYDFFRGLLPDAIIARMASLEIATLGHMTATTVVSVVLQIAGLLVIRQFQKAHCHS